jgi:hypothetical protein
MCADETKFNPPNRLFAPAVFISAEYETVHGLVALLGPVFSPLTE